jgi:hypothetical protein
VLSGTLPAGATLTTTIDGVAVPYVVAATDVDFPTLAGSVARAINASTAIDLKTGTPIGSVIGAGVAGPAVVLTSRSPANPQTAFTLACNSSNAGLVYAPTQGPLPATIASQLATGDRGCAAGGQWGRTAGGVAHRLCRCPGGRAV